MTVILIAFERRPALSESVTLTLPARVPACRKLLHMRLRDARPTERDLQSEICRHVHSKNHDQFGNCNARRRLSTSTGRKPANGGKGSHARSRINCFMRTPSVLRTAVFALRSGRACSCAIERAGAIGVHRMAQRDHREASLEAS